MGENTLNTFSQWIHFKCFLLLMYATLDKKPSRTMHLILQILLVAENLLHYMLQGMIDLRWEVARVYIISYCAMKPTSE